MRAGVALLLGLLMVCPTGVAADPVPGPLAKTLEEHIGQVRDGLDHANETYGPREEFGLARAELGRAELSLVNDATLLAEDGLIKASAALATGQSRAQPERSGDPGHRVVEDAEARVSEADAVLEQVRGDLSSMERTGLEPVALDGGLAVAHALIRVMDLRHQYQRAMASWEAGDHSEQVARSVMTGAAGALRMAHVAEDTLAEVAKVRQEAPPTPVLSYDALEAIADDRSTWSQAEASPLVDRSQGRVQAMHSNGEQLMTLAAYVVLFQDLAFNGLQAEHQRTNTATDPHQVATDLLDETAGPVDAWVDDLGVPGDLAIGGVASGRLTLALTDNLTGDNRANSGAYAASLIHLGAEHVGILQQGYGGPDHEPGTQLATPGQAETESEVGSDAPPLWLVGLLGAVVLLAVVRFWRDQT